MSKNMFEIIEVPVVEIDIRDFLGGLGVQLWSRPYSIKCIIYRNSYESHTKEDGLNVTLTNMTRPFNVSISFLFVF